MEISELKFERIECDQLATGVDGFAAFDAPIDTSRMPTTNNASVAT